VSRDAAYTTSPGWVKGLPAATPFQQKKWSEVTSALPCLLMSQKLPPS
jgi:hypothetical protein